MNNYRPTEEPIPLLRMRCRHASRLISQSLDRPLRGREKFSLRLHLLMCKWCRRYREQIRIIGSTIHQFAASESTGIAPVMPQTARDRIHAAIQNTDS